MRWRWCARPPRRWAARAAAAGPEWATSAGGEGGAGGVAVVRAGAAAVGGKGGGGRPEMAQAGGPELDKLPEALNAVRLALANRPQQRLSPPAPRPRLPHAGRH